MLVMKPTKPYATELTRRLLAAAKAQGRRLTWCAQQIGVPYGTLAPMLHGHDRARADVLDRLALLLGVPRTELARDDSTPNTNARRRAYAGGQRSQE